MPQTVTISKVQFNRIPAIARALTTEADKITQKTATDVQAEIVTSLEGPRTGLWYAIPGVHSSRKGGGGRRHRASAPGEKPARLFGILAAGIGIQRFYARAIVYSSAEESPHLEYGTRNMAPRPFMRPAARKFNRIFEAAVRIMVERAAYGKH